MIFGRVSIYQLTHLLTHSLTHSLTHLLTHLPRRKLECGAGLTNGGEDDLLIGLDAVGGVLEGSPVVHDHGEHERGVAQ